MTIAISLLAKSQPMLETVSSKFRFKAKASDRGRPVLQITPFEEPPQAVLEELRGSLQTGTHCNDCP